MLFVLALTFGTIGVFAASPAFGANGWSSPSNVDGSFAFLSVSCPTTSFCAAVDYTGDVVTYDGSTWSAPNDVDGGDYFRSVSCPTASFCAAVDESGDALTYNGSIWSAPNDIDGSNVLDSVSCPTAAFCAAVDGYGFALTYNGSTWSAPDHVDGHFVLESVSCPTASLCESVDEAGNVLSYNGSIWSAPNDINGTTEFFSVSCPTSGFCVAGDDTGNVLTYNGSIWSAPNDIDGSNAVTGMSCPTASFCAAVDSAGNALIYNAGTWSAPSSIDGSNFLPSVSCQSSTFCMAVDESGNVLEYSGPTQTVTVPCGSGTTQCSATLVAPSQTVAAAGSKTSPTSASVTVQVAVSTLPCTNFSYRAPVVTLTDTGLQSGTSVTVTDSVSGLPSKKGVVICYQPVESSPPAPVLLAKCHGQRFTTACTKSVTENSGSAVVSMLVPAGDPRFHVGGETPQVSGFSPAAPKAGKKLTIKGVNLSEVTSVTIGGVNARIVKTAPTKVSVISPAQVHGTIVVSSLAGTAASPSAVTVSAASCSSRRRC